MRAIFPMDFKSEESIRAVVKRAEDRFAEEKGPEFFRSKLEVERKLGERGAPGARGLPSTTPACCIFVSLLGRDVVMQAGDGPRLRLPAAGPSAAVGLVSRTCGRIETKQSVLAGCCGGLAEAEEEGPGAAKPTAIYL